VAHSVHTHAVFVQLDHFYTITADYPPHQCHKILCGMSTRPWYNIKKSKIPYTKSSPEPRLDSDAQTPSKQQNKNQTRKQS